VLACVLAPFNILVGVHIARQFGFLEFRLVGASDYLQGEDTCIHDDSDKSFKHFLEMPFRIFFK
jgi:hypothetical protein